jgi:hypothetical protein
MTRRLIVLAGVILLAGCGSEPTRTIDPPPGLEVAVPVGETDVLSLVRYHGLLSGNVLRYSNGSAEREETHASLIGAFNIIGSRVVAADVSPTLKSTELVEFQLGQPETARIAIIGEVSGAVAGASDGRWLAAAVLQGHDRSGPNDLWIFDTKSSSPTPRVATDLQTARVTSLVTNGNMLFYGGDARDSCAVGSVDPEADRPVGNCLVTSQQVDNLSMTHSWSKMKLVAVCDTRYLLSLTDSQDSPAFRLVTIDHNGDGKDLGEFRGQRPRSTCDGRLLAVENPGSSDGQSRQLSYEIPVL